MAGVGIQLSFGNIMQLMGILSPLILSAFLVISSISNGNLKWIMYLAGMIILVVLFTIITFTIDMKYESGSSGLTSGVCHFIQMPFGLSEYSAPSFNSTILGFIFAYLFMPMVQNNNYNIVFLCIIGSLFLIDAVTKIRFGCTPIVGVLLGGFFGYIVGYLWYSFMVMSGNNSLLFFNEGSNTQICSRPNKQTFKCAVFRNGEIIKNL
jgi:hypothetical protein